MLSCPWQPEPDDLCQRRVYTINRNKDVISKAGARMVMRPVLKMTELVENIHVHHGESQPQTLWLFY
jgi:hypothetical protein